ncbi:leucine-rich repeat domain-containing protein [Thalassoroseus pseudoceratinae]|uniref:hypothetical protein n=1 Tax=Thalassoroseus pseudoceratinae TaxID=2713176 RepID=UPI0014229F10|nr:hypothetical protein [Thalassoroseus pseudoceratinae]
MKFIRVLVVLVAIGSCVGCGSSSTRSAAVMGWVVARGGSVTVAGKSLAVKSLSDIDDGATEIQRIDLNGQDITDEDLKNLTVLSDLQFLGLHGAPITDAGVDALLEIENLKELELSATNITDAGVVKLAGLTSLEKLTLHNTTVTKKAIEELQNKVPGCQVIQ